MINCFDTTQKQIIRKIVMLIQQDNIPNCNKQPPKAASLNPEQRTNLAILALGKLARFKLG